MKRPTKKDVDYLDEPRQKINKRSRGKQPKRQNKYRAKPVVRETLDGKKLRFDSEKEANRYWNLCLRERAGEIRNLQRQVTYVLIPRQYTEAVKERELKYIADAVYEERGIGGTWNLVVEDVKGYRNPRDAAYRVFAIKRKLMLYRYGIVVREV